MTIIKEIKWWYHVLMSTVYIKSGSGLSWIAGRFVALGWILYRKGAYHGNQL